MISMYREYKAVITMFVPIRIIVMLESPGVRVHTLAKMDLQVKVSGRSKIHYGLVLSPDFSPTRSLSVHAESPVSQKRGSGVP